MELEVTKKVRLAIKAKLLELGVHVDEELPDYIMILIANRRTKIQMEDDLSLFLGDNTLKFTTWLFQVLRKLEEVTANSTAAATTTPTLTSQKSVEDATSKATTTTTAIKKTALEVPQPTTATVTKQEPAKAIITKSRPSTMIPTSDIVTSSNTVKRKTQKINRLQSGIKSPVLKKARKTSAHSSRSSSLSPEKINVSGLKSSTQKEKSVSDTLVAKKFEEDDYNSSRTKVSSSSSSPLKKLIRSKSPITAPPRSVSSSKHGRSRSPILTHSKLSSQVTSIRREDVNSPGSETKHRLLTISRDTVRSPQVESSVQSLIVHRSGNSKNSRSRSRSPLTNARKSLKSLVAVVKRHNEINATKDEEYNPSRPAVTSTAKGISSVVHVTERPKRATKQQERGSNNLLVRALADAQKSIVTRSMQSHTKTTDDKELKDTDSYRDDDQVDNDKANVISRRNSENVVDRKERQSDVRRKKKDDGVESKSRRSIKDRLGYRVDNKKDTRLEPEVRRKHYHVNDLDDLETDELDDDFAQGVDGDFKIRVNVATSKSAKERNVTLEKFDDTTMKQQSNIQSEISAEPKRLSIQLNVDSESSSSSSSDEDELEIQPRPSEDANFELSTTTTEAVVKSEEEQEEDVNSINSNISESKQPQRSVSSNSENYSEGEATKENQREEIKSEHVVYKQRPLSESLHTKQSLKQQEEQDDIDDEDEEEELEEYEIEEEEEEDEEECITRLPNVDQKTTTAVVHEMEIHDDYVSKHEPMETVDKETLYLTNSPGGSFDMDMDGGIDANQRDYSRYARTNAKSLNHSDTKFVVTMDGSDSLLYDEMETDQYNRYSSETMDLRQRISRTVVQSKPSTSVNQHQHGFPPITSTPLTSSLYNVSARAYLPITGAPIRPATTSTTTVGGAPACKYWPDCSFKDKCVYPHPKCKYGRSCTKPNCPYKHDVTFANNNGHGSSDGSKAPNSSAPENDGKIQCKFFPKCHSMSCTFYHPSPCRFGIGCTNAKCKSYHPGQTVGQNRSQASVFGSSSRGAGSRVVPPAAHLLRWKAPSTLESVDKEVASSSLTVDSTSISTSVTAET